MRKKYKIFLSALFAFCVYLGALYGLQNYLIFHPDKKYISPLMLGFQEFHEDFIRSDDGVSIRIWYAQGKKEKPALLFFHGNTGQIAFFAEQLNFFVKEGYPVLMMEYRGFAEVEGEISQEKVFSDASHAYNFLKSQGHQKIISFGYSFGSSVALGLTQHRSVDGIILIAPFASLYQEVQELPVPFARFVLKNHFPSDEYIQKINAPLLIIHSKKDKLIPLHYGQKLFDLASVQDKEIYFLDKENHNATFFKGASTPFVFKWLERKF